MAASENGCMLFVADWKKGLIAVERESGRRLWCYAGFDLIWATGVCLDGRGGVFVCGWGSDNVLQYSEGGKKIGEVVTPANRIEDPWSVCFLTDSSTLVVTQSNNDEIVQYQLSTK